MLRHYLDRLGCHVASSMVCALVFMVWPEAGHAQHGHLRAAAEHHAASSTCDKKTRKRSKSSAAASERREARKAKRLARQEAKRERAAKRRGKSGAAALPESAPVRDLERERERELQKERELDEQLAAANELQASTEPVPDAEPVTEPESECEDADPATCASSPELTATLGVYTGFTSRNITLPTIAGLATLDTGMLPSLAIQVGALAPGDAFFGVTFGYQSSLGAEASQAASDPLKPALSTSIQSHHFEGGVLGGFHFGGPESATLALFAGYGVRALASVVELRVPRFSLHGPVARIELELPLGAPWIALRLAPEMQLVLAMSEELHTLGVGSPIWAFGGEAGLRLRVSPRIALQLSFREAHAVVTSIYGGSFEDVERYGLFGLVVSYL